jgi:hypothetical protein
VSAASPSSATSRLRRFAALGVMLAYLLAGVSHGIHGLDMVHAPSSKPEIVILLDQAGHSDQKSIADRHCHGCFSVTVVQSHIVAALVAQMVAPNWPRPIGAIGMASDTDSPPPKYLI